MKGVKYIAFINILFLLCSCSTIQTVHHNPVGNKKREIYSEKLGIQLEQDFDINLIKEVIDWLGTPYAYGGEEKTGADCSGFVQQIYKKVYGIYTARSANGIYEACIKVNREKLKQGELVFFKINTTKVGHVGIFLQDSYFIHASSSKGVMVSSLELEYWTKYFVSGGKILKSG